MDTSPITPQRLQASVFAVPPLPRDSSLRVDESQTRKLVQFLESGGVTSLLYGGNAVFYHARLSEYAKILQVIADTAGEQTLVVPSVGPSFGMMMDQAEVLAEFDFPTVMVLPQTEVADASGIAAGIRRFVDVLGKPIVLYLKHDNWLPPEVVGKMHASGIVSWIKYAVVREDTSNDAYLRQVLGEVPSNIVVSGIGEQPAIIHMRDFEIGSFTSGCVCVNPSMSMNMLNAILAGETGRAEEVRAKFEGLENLRNAINPIRVLHRAVELAGIAETGPMLPLLGELSVEQSAAVASAAQSLKSCKFSV